MKDDLGRRFLKRIARFCYTFDLKTTRFIWKAKGEPKFELKGYCNGCGICCESPMIQTNPIFFHLKSVRWMILTWHRVVNGFEYVGENKRFHTFSFRCTHWDSETKLCDSYESRPGLCRDYPRNLTYTVDPQFFEQCSYYAVHKNAARLRKSLENQKLPPEKLAEIYEKLHLKE